MYTENKETRDGLGPQQLFTREELGKFGEYLLSQKRTERINSTYEEGDSVSKEERLAQVYHADVENFIAGL